MKKFTKQKFTEQKFEAIKTLMGHGLKASEIAKALGCSYATVNRVSRVDTWEEYCEMKTQWSRTTKKAAELETPNLSVPPVEAHTEQLDITPEVLHELRRMANALEAIAEAVK